MISMQFIQCNRIVNCRPLLLFNITDDYIDFKVLIKAVLFLIKFSVYSVSL